MYLTDYHHHTDHSFDSKAKMDDVCKAAIKKGINEICFTEHFSVNPKAPTFGHMNFERYFTQIRVCQKQYEEQLTIKAGIELCEPHLMKEDYDQALKNVKFDFVLGSVHNIKEEKLRTFMMEKESTDAYRTYFEEVYSLVSSADIDVLAHLDLLKRYAIETKGNYSFTAFEDILRGILQKSIERGIGIEINTSGLSNGKLREAFPTLDILKLYKKIGGEILTIGSDSHRADTVGEHLRSALHMAKQAGFNYIFTFTKRKPKAIKIKV
ncbi:histidinol-phosphatase HisJ family protein [Salipaludibacillus agaradhaerens]|uniref:histidinol-phosphatase HisJ family protein n=1 Tax=Salipaludibacillus agaradhaerens TaxID=76935 RepID=UPI002151F89E|nr:histidinol-phosphatase HisJ family protein [Salipaludibacillus agaradhaerens]MCR6105429.1 histidinol-phosphatase HisJ family protein [Salipaludibacillus agaradhaerens]MCR6117468.1 histidinol-phosphatase HisJ family protein [Salipaludibacillus agaradhaerens]UJW56657.1 histidinol-phosphatase HisJ family protein [Bacillus sp. A116_S68]